MDTLLSPLSATSQGLQRTATHASDSLPPATPSAPPPLGAEGSSSPFASRVGNSAPSTHRSITEGVSASVMMGGVAKGVTAALMSSSQADAGRSTQVEGRASGRGAPGRGAALRAAQLDEAAQLGQSHSHAAPMDPVGEMIHNPVAASSSAVGRARTVPARRHPAAMAGPPRGLSTHGTESGASAHATNTLVTGGASNSSVTAESVLQEAIALPAGERVLFFNDLRLHLHREGLLSMRNRTSKRQRTSSPDVVGAHQSVPVPLDALDDDPVGSAPVESAPLPPLTFSDTVTTAMTTTMTTARHVTSSPTPESPVAGSGGHGIRAVDQAEAMVGLPAHGR